jgi:threonine synthase
VLGVEGSFDRALGVVRELGVERDGWAVVNSLNPYRLWGQRTAAWEIVRELGDGPDYLALPVGNAGNITAYGQGFRESLGRGEIKTRPRLLGFQAQGAAPLVLGHPVEEPRTVASAIRIGKPVNWKTALEEVRESGGRFEAVPDEEILEAYSLLASREGVFAEPASACALAGVRRLAEKGFFPPGSRVVVVLTGNGLKDPETAIERAAGVEMVPPDPEAVRRYLRF